MEEKNMKNRFWTISIPFVVLVAVLFYFTAQFIQPSPKREITIATGSENGNYYKTALRYKKLLEKDNVKVNVLTSSGSIDNVKLLKEHKVDIAFIQNGTITQEEVPHIKALASVYYEPLWIFYKNPGYSIDYVIQLITKKISIGAMGSGTKDLAINILKDNGIDDTNSKLLNYSSSKAKDELLRGNIDAMFVVSSYDSPIVKELLSNPDISILSVKRAKAYGQKYSFLEALTLYEGTIDLYTNTPSENVNLLSTTANLVVNEDFSDDLKRIFLKKIVEAHNIKTPFSKAGEFPNIFNMTLEIDEEAKRYFEYGDTFLEKIFPYWIASNIDRLKILLIPLLTLLLPLFKGAFPLYTWSMRSKIYKWYDEVKEIDSHMEELSKDKLKVELKKLEDLRKEISEETKVPLSFMGEYYNLQLHIDHVKERIIKLL